jgi:hypothetical protein
MVFLFPLDKPLKPQQQWRCQVPPATIIAIAFVFYFLLRQENICGSSTIPPNITPSSNLRTIRSSSATTTKLADGCHHIFLDVGANIGVHSRFLFEPDKYPNADKAHSIFDA